MHTKDFLAGELRAAGLGDMAIKAAQGYYHDFLSPLAMPETQLHEDLTAALGRADSVEAYGRIADLVERHMAGEFDASKEESDEWAASPDGQAAFGSLVRGR